MTESPTPAMVRKRFIPTEKYLTDFNEYCNGKSMFVSTGYESLDTVLTEGLALGRMVVIAGRSRTGKSTFAADMLCRLVFGKFEGKILMLPLEGGPDRILDMMVSNITNIDTTKLVKFASELTLDERERVRNAIKAINDSGKIDIVENPFLGCTTNEEVMEKVEEIYAEGGYTHALFDMWERMMYDLRAQALARALFRQQMIAEKYKTCTIMMHQLKRLVEERKDKRPSLTDLKSSGAYEEVSDLVLLMHREKIYKPFVNDDIAELRIAKQKRGMDNVTMLANFAPDVCKLFDDRLGSLEDEGEVAPQFQATDPGVF